MRRVAGMLAGALIICACARAQEVTPVYPIPARPLLFELASPFPPATLVGLNLAQGSRRYADTPARLEEGIPLEVRLYWQCKRLETDAEVHLRIEGAGPTFHAAAPVPMTSWEVDGTYPQSCALPLPRLRYSGKGTLRISIETEGPEQVLFAMPVFIVPTGAPSPVADADLQTFFGADTQRLGEAVRLGPGATIAWPVPVPTIHRVGIVSGVHHDPSLKQGEAVAAIRFYQAEALLAEVPVQAGVNTAASNYAYYPAGYIDAEPIQVFSRRMAGGNDTQGQPYEILTYGATIPFAQPLAADRVEIVYLRQTGVFEILDLVF
ncbi:MAG: hypothetical protein IT368_18930 [Candidatus Hydrogenedentes bacterium]|nr:hypothetical protein [Candidatus Hydrogenedentota bacterium]